MCMIIELNDTSMLKHKQMSAVEKNMRNKPLHFNDFFRHV